jgi:hypothetical protein
VRLGGIRVSRCDRQGKEVGTEWNRVEQSGTEWNRAINEYNNVAWHYILYARYRQTCRQFPCEEYPADLNLDTQHIIASDEECIRGFRLESILFPIHLRQFSLFFQKSQTVRQTEGILGPSGRGSRWCEPGRSARWRLLFVDRGSVSKNRSFGRLIDICSRDRTTHRSVRKMHVDDFSGDHWFCHGKIR